MDFANAGKVLYTPEQFFTTVYGIIFATGYFAGACCRWKQKPVASKTWAKFKMYFAEEHRVW